MSGTALYRALTRAGAPDEDAKEASDIIDGCLNRMDGRLNRMEVMIAEVRATNRIMIAFSLATFLLLLKIALE